MNISEFAKKSMSVLVELVKVQRGPSGTVVISQNRLGGISAKIVRGY